MAKSTRHEVVTRDTELLNTCSRSGSEASLRPFSSSLEEIVPGAIRNINASEVFAESLRSELNNYKCQPPLEGTDEFCVLKTLYDDSPSDSRILFISVLMRA